MKRYVSTLLLIILSFHYVLATETTKKPPKVCKLNHEEIKKANFPLILTADELHLQLYYPINADIGELDNPEYTDTLEFLEGENFRVGCPQGSVMIDDINYEREIVELTCIDDKLKESFRLHPVDNKKNINFSSIKCSEKSRSVLVKEKEKEKSCAHSQGTLWKLGFKFEQGFLETIRLCYDEMHALTYWAHEIIVPKRIVKIVKRSSKHFRRDGLDKSINFKYAYSKAGVYDTLRKLLENIHAVESADKYVINVDVDDEDSENDSQQYIARGHLAANANGFYKVEQDSTYYYANVVPMWQVINNGNWKRIENIVRNYANLKNRKLDVYTGGLKVLNYSDLNPNSKHDTEIHLWPSLRRFSIFDQTNPNNRDDGIDKIPVPMYLFKFVISKKDDAAIVFVTVNNPYWELDEKKKHYRICQPLDDKVCPSLSHKSFKDPAKGFTYCCEAEDFMKKNFPYIREEKISSILELVKILKI